MGIVYHAGTGVSVVPPRTADVGNLTVKSITQACRLPIHTLLRTLVAFSVEYFCPNEHDLLPNLSDFGTVGL